MIIYFKGRRYRISTGEVVPVKYWIPATEKVKSIKQFPEANAINRRLKAWRSIGTEAMELLTSGLTVPNTDDVRAEIDRIRRNRGVQTDLIAPWIDEYIDRSNKAGRTRINYRFTLKVLKAYETFSKKNLRFQDIDIVFYKKFQSYCNQAGYSLNTFGSFIKNLKAFMNESEDDIHHGCTGHHHKKFSSVSETADTVYLSIDELTKIHNLNIDWELVLEHFPKMPGQNIARKVEALKLARDWFLIGAFTALRVSDFTRIKETNIRDGFIRINPKKGSNKSEDVIIPMHPVIADIIDRGLDYEKKVYDQKVNARIKEICMMSGINDLVTITRTEKGVKKSYTMSKDKLITTHTARRSAATNMYKAGIPSLAIMKITGHRTEKSFLKYIKISQEENARMLADHPFFKRS